MSQPSRTHIDTLLERYDTLLLDAYGVLVDASGPLPGAIDLIERLQREQRHYLLLTNSASRLPESMAADFQKMGLPIPAERIVSSGMLLAPLFAERRLEGAECLVLGPEDAREYVRRAGGNPHAPGTIEDAEVIVIADQKGFELQQGLDDTLSLLLRRIERELDTTLLLCNPDLIYPVGSGRFGITAGAIASMLDHILRERYPQQAPQFEPLGKPHRPIFDAAARQADGKMLMLGDQLGTDILGARRFGIDSALVLTGLSRWPTIDPVASPNYLLNDLQR